MQAAAHHTQVFPPLFGVGAGLGQLQVTRRTREGGADVVRNGGDGVLQLALGAPGVGRALAGGPEMILQGAAQGEEGFCAHRAVKLLVAVFRQVGELAGKAKKLGAPARQLEGQRQNGRRQHKDQNDHGTHSPL